MQRPPTAGAVDLAALKNKPDEAQENQAIHEALSQLNLVCDCGNVIEHGGQEVIVVAVGIVQTPRGPARGMNVNKRSFCSVGCQFFKMFKQAAVAQETLLVVSRALPTNFWIKKPFEHKEDDPITANVKWSESESDPVSDIHKRKQQIYEES